MSSSGLTRGSILVIIVNNRKTYTLSDVELIKTTFLLKITILFAIFFSLGTNTFSKEYQNFENSGSVDEYAWTWEDNTTINISPKSFKGGNSLNLKSVTNLQGVGIKSINNNWSIDLVDDEKYLNFSIFSLASNGMDNTVLVEIFDNNNHSTEETKVTYWTKQTAYYNEWTSFQIPLSKFPLDTDWNSINKIQFKFYWPGSYYIDNIFTSLEPTQTNLSDGLIESITNQKQLNLVTTNGRVIVDSVTKEEIQLKGVNIGGVFALEPWISEFRKEDGTLYANEKEYLDSLRLTMSENEINELLLNYQKSFLTDQDIQNIASVGFNYVRLPISYSLFINEDGTWKENKYNFEIIDKVIARFSEYGIHTLIGLHYTPGSMYEKDGKWIINNSNCTFEDHENTKKNYMITDEIWKKIAEHYKDNPAILGYDLLNEPECNIYQLRNNLWEYYNSLYKSVRETDKDHLIFIQAVWDLNTLPRPSKFNWTKTVYEVHLYSKDRTNIDTTLSLLEKSNMDHEYYSSLYDVPIIVGEMNGFDDARVWRKYLTSFNERKIGWTIWNYKTFYPNYWGLFACSNEETNSKCEGSITNKSMEKIIKEHI